MPEQHVQVDKSRRLGGGALGEVFHASWFGSPVVVKRLYFMDDDPAAMHAMGGPLSTHDRQHVMRDFYRECLLNSNLRHSNIVPFLGVVVDAALQPRYLMLELMSGRSLDHLIHPDGINPGTAVPLPHAKTIVIDLCRALAYLHSRQPPVLHLDIKPANILLDAASGRAKLGDLGESHVINSARTRTGTIAPHGVGTPLYMAPEMQFADSIKNHKTDMFSLGVVVAEITSGMRPNPGAAMRQIVVAGRRVWEEVPEEERRAADIDAAIQHQPLQQLARQLIVHDPDQRLSAIEALAQAEAIDSA